MQDQPPQVEAPAAREQPRDEARLAAWEKPIAVLLLSLFVAGLGQVVNRQPWKGLGFAVSAPLLSIFAAHVGAYRTFRGLIAAIVLVFALRAWICVDGFRVARRRRASSPSQSYSLGVLGISGALVVGIAVLASMSYFVRESMNFRAFRTASDSFCPTLCRGERFVVDIDAYRASQPKRGDVIAFDFHGQHKPYFVKRIAGIEGDVVSERDGNVFVNGEHYAPNDATQKCGQAPAVAPSDRDEPHFDDVTVPPGSFFVVGDNSTNSNDSRIEGFGFVTPDQIAGKLMYIYWSPNRSRIGCKIE
jgi:signal peptidase I